jgi:hypothetical protein
MFKGNRTSCADFHPTITAHPQNKTICEGMDAMFSVTANGNGTLHYRWKKNGADVGGDSNTLTLNNVPADDDNASIVCVVSDDCGTATSNAATLRVHAGTTNTEFAPATAALNGPVDSGTPWEENVWGFTVPVSVSVTISATCETGQWCAVLTGLTGNYDLRSRLLPGVTEVTGPGGNTNKDNFCAQARDLGRLTLGAGQWFMLAAVQAHENLHLTRYLPALRDVAPLIERDFEALCVPMTPNKTQADAIAEITALPAFAAARRDALTTWSNRRRVLTAGDHGAPAGTGPTYDAERGVVNPMMMTICTASNMNCWGQCNPPCTPVTRGACCAAGMVCTCEEQANCAGAFQGPGSTCDPNPCP